MSRQTTLITVLLTCLCILGFGCDPVRKTLQPVLLKVTDSTSGRPLADVQVSLKWDFNYYVPKTNEWNEWKRATEPSFFGKADADGQAQVDLKYVVLDSTSGSTPPPWRDQVTGTAYLIRVEKDTIYEEHSLVMRPGAFVRGKAFTVQVLQIQAPRYIRMDE